MSAASDIETDEAMGRGAPRRVKRNWYWIAAMGAVLIIGGALAIAMPVAAGVAATVFIGVALLIGGAMQVWDAVAAEGWRARAWHAVSGAIYVVGGLMLLFQPLLGVVALSLLVVSILIADGAVRVVMGVRMRPERGWGWMTASGALSVLLGLGLVAFALPAVSVTLLGVAVGVSLICEGAAFIYLGVSARPDSGGEPRVGDRVTS